MYNVQTLSPLQVVTLRFQISMENMSLGQWLPTDVTLDISCGETHPGITFSPHCKNDSLILSICGPDGSWQGSPPRCHLLTCGSPPLVENAVVELLNGSTSWQSFILYQCSAGYYDVMQGTFWFISFISPLIIFRPVLHHCLRMPSGWKLESCELEMHL